MIGRRQRNRPSAPVATAVAEPAVSGDAPAIVVTGDHEWLPAGQRHAATAGSQTATESWVPAEIGAGSASPAGAAGAFDDPVAWRPAQAAAATSNVDATAATAALVPEEWLVEGGAAQSHADATAAIEVKLAPTRWLADAPTIGTPPLAAPAAPPPGDEARHAPLLRFGLPVAVVAVSLVVALAIAGVFSTTSGSRPAATPSNAAGAPTPTTASPAPVKPAPAKAKHAAAGARPARHHTTRNSTQSHHAAQRSSPVASPAPAPRPVAPVRVPHTPASVAPAPPHRAPAAPQHTTPPRHISQTRPTHRSGAPGRQPISG